jgi:hypothetical protein
MLILRAEQPREEGVVGELVFLRVRELVVDDCRDLLQMKAAEELIDLVGRSSPRRPAGNSPWRSNRRIRRSRRSS